MKRKILICLLCFVLLVFANPVFALEIAYPKVPGADKTPEQCFELASEEQLACYIKYIYSLSLAVSGIVCFAVFLFGGILYLISGGSVEKTKEARTKMFSALTGTGFLLMSYLILNALNPQLLILSIKKELFSSPPLEPLIEIEESSFSYVEIPLGWLIERVEARIEAVGAQTGVVGDFVAEEKTPGHPTLKELAQCLKKLSQECDCSELGAECILADPEDNECQKKCLGDPCDKTISSDFCQEFDATSLNPHLRTSMKDIAVMIDEANAKINEEKGILESAQSALDKEKQKLELAEFLMTNAFPPPTALHDIVEVLTEPPKILDVWEEMDPTPLLVLPEKKQDDPAHFYVSEEENKDLIEIIKSVVFTSTNLPLDWEPPDPPPLPTDPDAVILNIPAFFQMDAEWATTQINNCNDKLGVKSPPCEAITGCGCGPTSLAMILSYFLDPNIKPDDVAIHLEQNQEYFCGIGSSAGGLAQWAHNNYGLEFEQISFNQIQANIRNGKPVLAACHHFGSGYGIDWEHISVIKGIEQGYVYFQDSVVDEAVFNENTVQNSFACTSLFALSQL